MLSDFSPIQNNIGIILNLTKTKVKKKLNLVFHYHLLNLIYFHFICYLFMHFHFIATNKVDKVYYNKISSLLNCKIFWNY